MKQVRSVLSILLSFWLAICLVWMPFVAEAAEPAGTKPLIPESWRSTCPETYQALELAIAGDLAKSRSVLEDAYRRTGGSRSCHPDIPYFLAAFAFDEENPKAAIKYLLKTQSLLQGNNQVKLRRQMLLSKRLGDCYYERDQCAKAIQQYMSVLAFAGATRDNNLLLAETLESLMANESNLKRFVDAERHGQQLVETCRARLSAGNMMDTLNYCWALLQLADLYRHTNQKEKLASLRQEIRELFTALVDSRMLADASGQMPDYDTLVATARKQYIAAAAPESAAEVAWAASSFRVKTLPIIAWKNQSVKPLAAIVCIHGLGLENRSFINTAQELARKGYLVYALDVRGFGSWTQTKGEESLDYPQTLADIRNVTETIKRRSPGIKVCVLGESMGGAIALRAGSQLSDVVDGVISSVPSAERFQEKRMALQTTLHLMMDPGRAFNIGSEVAERATSHADARSRWENDPKAKLSMTPVELINFAVFMRLTKREAARITSTPVLMVQGLKDRLVNPRGTFELFSAIKNTDKTILVIGTAEHLMFECDSPDPVLIDAVDSWLRHHCAAQGTIAPATSPTGG
jgi:acylglycerol lipase